MNRQEQRARLREAEQRDDPHDVCGAGPVCDWCWANTVYEDDAEESFADLDTFEDWCEGCWRPHPLRVPLVEALR